MISHMPPGLIMILAAFLLPVIPHVWRQIYMLGAIALSAYGLFLGAGTHLVLTVLGLDLILYQADALSLPFAIIFHLAAALNVIYSWHDRDWQHNTDDDKLKSSRLALIRKIRLLFLSVADISYLSS